jgi:predicted TIM-barrel fold metal-dependent hydrolase
MLIDCHTHLTSDPEESEPTRYWRRHHRIPDCVLEPYLKAMESMDRVIVLAWPYPPYSACGNEAAAQLTKEYGDKFLLFWAVNPRLPTALSNLERGVQEHGAVGVKMSSLYMKFKPDDRRYFPLYERIQELGLPVMWHQGSSFEAVDGPLEWAQPWRLDKVARTFPELKIVISHFGFPWVREAVALLRKRPNLYTDISSLGARTWILYDALVNAVQYGATEKIFFGSDYPLFTPEQMRAALYEAAAIPQGTNLPQVPAEVIDSILQRNCLEILGIQ